MRPENFLKTIYLGDRGCKAIAIDSWCNRVAIQATVISRLKPGTKVWDFYSQADIPNGWLVFSNVRSIEFSPPGLIPNDLINDFSVRSVKSDERAPIYMFEFRIDSVDANGNSEEVIVKIQAERIHIEDPARPGTEIVE